MKATLKFDLLEPDEKEAHFRCVKSLDMALCLFDMQSLFRQKDKMGLNVIDDEEFYDILNKYNLVIDELVT